MGGPLTGFRIIEFAGLGPGPFASMMLSDMGAEVVRVDRPDKVGDDSSVQRVLGRNRRSIALDVKAPAGRDTALALIDRADAVIEGFRPGVMERLGLGPDRCLERNPRIVFGRMTGWGQDGPYANVAGHDINYIALAGALAHFARDGQAPVPPLNLVGDYGGGGMLLAFGIVCGLLESSRSGVGQIIDAAMVDGTALLMSLFWGQLPTGVFDGARPGTNMLDTGAHFYDVYECKDGAFISIGAIEPQFYSQLLERMGLDGDAEFLVQGDRARWPDLKRRLSEVVKTRTRAEWTERLEYTDVCFAPVLSMEEAALHPHNLTRQTFVNANGIDQPAPAPRFSRTPAAITAPAAQPGEHSEAILADWGFGPATVAHLISSGVVIQAK